MKDALDKLAADVKSKTLKYAAKVAEIHQIPEPKNEYQRGYNAAVAEITARLRRM